MRRKTTIDLIEQSGAVQLSHQDSRALLRHTKRERQIGRRRELAANVFTYQAVTVLAADAGSYTLTGLAAAFRGCFSGGRWRLFADGRSGYAVRDAFCRLLCSDRAGCWFLKCGSCCAWLLCLHRHRSVY
jgi:hypothetical protein